MAIIIGSGGTDLDKIILSDRRPIISLDDARTEWSDADKFWSSRFSAAKENLLRASRSVGCLVPENQRFVSTAFVVAPKLAVTASHVADAIMGRGPVAHDTKPRVWLDFADGGDRIEIAAFHQVHPYWRFSFLTLSQAVPSDRILSVADAGMRHRMQDHREICVIGFPSVSKKALMLGEALGVIDSEEFGRVIQHDASTLPGTSGAPLVDLQSGVAIGMHFAGNPASSNYAAPAWEFNRDPQWAWLWSGQMLNPSQAAPPSSPTPGAPLTVVFAPKRLLELQKLLVQHRLFEKTAALFAVLPQALVAELAEMPTLQDRLFVALTALNRKLYLLEGELPIVIVLDTAETLSFDLQRAGDLKTYRKEAEQVRAVIAGDG